MAMDLNIAMLMLDLRRAEERAEMEGWIDADTLGKELEEETIDYWEE